MSISNLWSRRRVLLYYAERFFGRKPVRKVFPKLPDTAIRPKVRLLPRQCSDVLYLELEAFSDGKWRAIRGSRILAVAVVRTPDNTFPSGTRLVPSIPLSHKDGYVWRIVEFEDFPASRILAIHVPRGWNPKLWFSCYGFCIPVDLLGQVWKCK